MNNRTTIMIALLAVVMMMGAASAAIIDGSWTAGADGPVFVGEPVTITWNSSASPTYLLIINGTTGEFFKGPVQASGVVGGTFMYSYEWDTATAGITSPNDTQNIRVCINDSVSGPATTGDQELTIPMNNLSASITPDQTGVSVLKGSTIEVSLDTFGAMSNSYRAGATFIIETNDTAAIVEQPTMNSTTGNGTGNVTPMTVGNGFTITVYAEDATKHVFTYNVSKLGVIALEVAANADDTNLTYVNVTDVDGDNVNIDRDTNVTLTLDTTARPNDKLNDSGSDKPSMNITILSGNNTTAGYGNITFPINATIGSTGDATGTITATTNTSTESWSADYGVHPAGEKITLNVTPSSASVGADISISGWIANASATVDINITDADGNCVLQNTAATVRPLDGHYTYTWVTNDTWMNYHPFPSTLPVIFTVKANSSDAGLDNETIEPVTLSNDLTVEPNVTSAYIDQVVNISATSSRLNGTLVTINITDSTDRCVYFNDTYTVTGGVVADWTWCLNAVNASNTTLDPASSPAENNNRAINKTGEYTITLNDTATSVTATIELNDELAVNDGTGVPGLNVTITGTSSRADGNTINVSIKGPSLIYKKTVNGTTYDYNATTHTSKWNATWKAVMGTGSSVGAGDYTVTATDSIATSPAATYVLGTANLTIEAPASAMVDDVIRINGTSNLEPGAVMSINITSGTKDINVSELNAPLQPDGTYSCVWTVNQSNASMYAAGFTQPSETYTITVSNTTGAGVISQTAEIVVSDTLTLTDAAGVPGDAVTISGTSNRINGTKIKVIVTATNYEEECTGTVLNGAYNAQWNAISEGTPLPTGDYTVTANDTIVEVVTGTATLSAAYVSLTAPASGASIQLGTPVDLVGTTNKQNGTVINFRITGPNYVNDSISAIANEIGDFNATWDTTGRATGPYYIIAKNGSVESTVVPVTLVKMPDLIVESITPNCGGYLFGNESNNISAVIKNDGIGDAGAFDVSFVLGDGYSEIVSVTALGVGNDTTVSITDPTIRNAGDTVTITVTADCNGEVTESNETNNVTTLDDVTVVNNGYKGKTYTGGSNITTVKSYDLNGDLVYSVGDSSYLSGSSNWADYDVAWAASDLPVTGTVREARLYVLYTWDKDGVMPGDVSMSFNGVAQTQDAHYWDEKMFATSYPYGMLVYNVTDDFNASGNIANLTNSHSGGGNVSIRGMLLVVVYEDASEPQRLIYVNEEFDMLYGGSGKCTTPEEATAWAPITGSIEGTVESAKLITVAPGAGPTEGELIFNGQVWNDVWNYAGSSQIGIDERNVKDNLTETDNLVGFQSSGDYMEASNVFLVVTVGEAGLDKDGDINNDGEVTMTDAVYLAKHVVELSGYETIYADGDINNDGEVTMTDAVYLAKHVVELSGYETIY